MLLVRWTRVVWSRLAALALVTAAGLAGAAAPAAAAAPLNDNYENRLPLQLEHADTRSNTDATIEPNEPFTANDPSGSACDKQGNVTTGAGGVQTYGTLWWEFTGTGGSITVSSLPSNFDTVLVVYDISNGRDEVACNDDIQPGDPTRPDLEFRPASEVRIDTVAGHKYAIQVGGCTPASSCYTQTSGEITIRVSPPPPNDARAAAKAILAGASVDTTNTGATTEPSEVTACPHDNTQSLYAKTVWFRWTAPAVGTAEFSVSGVVSGTSTKDLDTVMAVYRANSLTPLACNDDAVKGSYGGSQLPMIQPPGSPIQVVPGDYLIQVGGYYDPGFTSVAARNGPMKMLIQFTPDPDVDNDGVERPADCNDRDPRVRPGAREIPNNRVDENCDGIRAQDRDEDGSLAPRAGRDCNDQNPRVHPGAKDIGDDGIDEDCKGGDAPLPDLPTPSPSIHSDIYGSRTLVDRLVSGSIEGRTTITIRCRGR
jgi:hypothetical protein